MRTGDGSLAGTYDQVVLLDKRTGQMRVHGIVLDFAAWPTMRVTPPPYSVSEEALMDFIEVHRQLVHSMPGPYVLILDLREAGHMSAGQRKKLTDTMASAKDELSATCAGAAFVFSSAMMRGMLTAVFWLFKPPYPVTVVQDLPSAQRWVGTLFVAPVRKSA